MQRQGLNVTVFLIGMNVALYLVTAASSGNIMSPGGRTLVTWGANFAPLTAGNFEVWRLLTSVFLHGGLMHLAVNMYSLYSVGSLTEFLYGSRKFAAIYLVSGILASGASLMVNLVRKRPAISIGASGAVFAIYAVFLVTMWLRKDIIRPEARQSMLQSGLVFIGFNLFFGLASSGIDNAAHIGGLLAGTFFGLILAPGIKPR